MNTHSRVILKHAKMFCSKFLRFHYLQYHPNLIRNYEISTSKNTGFTIFFVIIKQTSYEIGGWIISEISEKQVFR
jgi:hypothetical protein